jgi:hypothetical protein
MKVALCLRGHMRTYKKAHHYIQDLRKICDLDIFIHTWDDLGYWAPDPGTGKIRSVKDEGTINLNSGKIDVSNILELYDPKAMVVEDYSMTRGVIEDKNESLFSWYEEVHRDPTVATNRTHSFISQIYKDFQTVSLKNSYANKTGDKYDAVVVTRPDVSMNIHLEALEEISSSSDCIWVRATDPHVSNHSQETLLWVCNSFFAGSERSIDKMCNLFEEFENVKKELHDLWITERNPMSYARMFCIHQLSHYQLLRKQLTPKVSSTIQSSIIR